jgi:hypothetical protein
MGVAHVDVEALEYKQITLSKVGFLKNKFKSKYVKCG